MSYEEEMKALGEWFKQTTSEYLEALNKEGPVHGFDSPLDEVRKRDVKEYNRRLLELKARYGVK
jgi:hypothetical protein